MASPVKVRELHFPSGGVHRRAGFSAQPVERTEAGTVYTTPWAVNCRPEDPGTLRLRGGARPGLTRTATVPPAALSLNDDLLTEGGVALETESTVNLSAGNLPSGATFGCLYRDRLVVSGGDNGIYGSRQGAYADWNFGAAVEDTGRAIIFQLAEGGEVGSTPTALIPHKDQFLLAATGASLWAVHGDPASPEGTLRNVHREVGVVGPTAWCKIVDEVVFLAQNDLYRVSASGESLVNLTKGNIPQELRGINATSTTVSLGYDHDGRGVYVFLSPPVDVHWFYDLNANGWWPVQLPSGMVPSSVAEVAGQLILTGGDGYNRIIGGTDDDGTAIQSHLLIGPMLLSDPASFGRLRNIQGTLGVGSATVAWNVVIGDTAEEAVTKAQSAIVQWQAGNTAAALAYVSYSGTFAAGRSHVAWPHLRVAWMVVWLQASAPWSFEQALVETQPDGRWR